MGVGVGRRNSVPPLSRFFPTALHRLSERLEQAVERYNDCFVLYLYLDKFNCLQIRIYLQREKIIKDVRCNWRFKLTHCFLGVSVRSRI